MNFQITPAATNDIAIGRKTNALATLSYLTRSVSTATIRPSVNDQRLKTTSQMRLFRSATSVSPLPKNAVVSSPVRRAASSLR